MEPSPGSLFVAALNGRTQLISYWALHRPDSRR